MWRILFGGRQSLVRRLIHLKVIEPDSLIEIGRGDNLSFETMPTSRWAVIDYSDTNTHGLRVTEAYVGPAARRLQAKAKRE